MLNFERCKNEMMKLLNTAEKYLSQALQLDFLNVKSEQIKPQKELSFDSFDTLSFYFRTRTEEAELGTITDINFNLRSNQITEEGAQFLGIQLTKMPNLQKLNMDLSKNNLNEKGARYVAAALSKLTELSQLNLNLS